jgi:hypothetical protein
MKHLQFLLQNTDAADIARVEVLIADGAVLSEDEQLVLLARKIILDAENARVLDEQFPCDPRGEDGVPGSD